MNADIILNSIIISYATVGLTYATFSIFKHNRQNSKMLSGLYGMYAATLAYLGCEFADDLGFPGFHAISKVLFIVFLTIAMPWSLNVYMRLTDHFTKKKNEKATQN